MKRPRGAGETQQRPIVDLARVLEALLRRHADLEAALLLHDSASSEGSGEVSRAFDGIERAIACMAATTLPEAAVQILIARGYAVQLSEAGAASSERIERMARLLESALPVVAAAAGTDLADAIVRRYGCEGLQLDAAGLADGSKAPSHQRPEGEAASPNDPPRSMAESAVSPRSCAAPAAAPPAAALSERRAQDRAAIWRRIGEAREAQADLIDALDAYELADVIDVSGDRARAGAHYQRALGIATALEARAQLPPAQEWLVGDLAQRLAAITSGGHPAHNHAHAGLARTRAPQTRTPH